MEGKMDSKVIIEAIGYIGSALVLISMLMTSVVKLRLIRILKSSNPQIFESSNFQIFKSSNLQTLEPSNPLNL